MTMKTFAGLFAVFAAVGLLLSTIAHVSAIVRRPLPLGKAVYLLHVGIFVVWFPAVLTTRVGKSLRGRLKLSDTPVWMRIAAFAIFGYAMLSFVLCWSGAFGPVEDDFIQLRMFSGHWILFYGMAATILYTYAKTGGAVRRCVNGHVVAPGSTSCAECGQPVTS